jgi:hypothetical protein
MQRINHDNKRLKEYDELFTLPGGCLGGEQDDGKPGQTVVG